MQKTTNKFSQRPRRKLEDLNLLDDFLFQEMLAQKETGEPFCRILLSTILGRPIRKVKITPQKNVLGIDTDKHGIRMDAYIEDVSDESIPGCAEIDAEIIDAGIVDTGLIDTENLPAKTPPDIYDIEPNITHEKRSLPKRMRYYHGLIDTQVLATGINYHKLPKVVIIVILPYDPFDKNRMLYTIKNHCVEDNAVSYDDGATKIFLYTRGTEGNPSQALRDMLKYIETTTDDNVSNQDIASIHNLVAQVKVKKEVGINYMKSWEREEMIRDEAMREGCELGIKQGQESLLLEKIHKKLSKGRSIDQIADALEETPERIKELIAENNLE